MTRVLTETHKAGLEKPDNWVMRLEQHRTGSQTQNRWQVTELIHWENRQARFQAIITIRFTKINPSDH